MNWEMRSRNPKHTPPLCQGDVTKILQCQPGLRKLCAMGSTLNSRTLDLCQGLWQWHRNHNTVVGVVWVWGYTSLPDLTGHRTSVSSSRVPWHPFQNLPFRNVLGMCLKTRTTVFPIMRAHWSLVISAFCFLKLAQYFLWDRQGFQVMVSFRAPTTGTDCFLFFKWIEEMRTKEPGHELTLGLCLFRRVTIYHLCWKELWQGIRELNFET